MRHEQQPTSFGAYLQNARIESRMSIASLAAETRIREEVLRRLEAEEHASLPDEVYIKGFIRSYALAVGADVEEALDRYRASCKRLKEESQGKAMAAVRPKRFWLGLVAAVGAVALMAGGTFHIYSRLMLPPAEPAAVDAPAAKPVPAATVENAEALATDKPPARAADIEEPGDLAEDKPAGPLQAASPLQAEERHDPSPLHRLEIKATEETWLKIIVDEHNAQAMTLKVGEIEKIEAVNHFNLLIGNAGGVELKLNDVPVAVSGQSGQVVNLELP